MRCKSGSSPLEIPPGRGVPGSDRLRAAAGRPGEAPRPADSLPPTHAGRTEAEVRRHLERNIAKRLGNGAGALAEPERFRRMGSDPEVVARVDGQLPESPLIVERPRQTLS